VPERLPERGKLTHVLQYKSGTQYSFLFTSFAFEYIARHQKIP
jgi:hypothetical protein